MKSNNLIKLNMIKKNYVPTVRVRANKNCHPVSVYNTRASVGRQTDATNPSKIKKKKTKERERERELRPDAFIKHFTRDIQIPGWNFSFSTRRTRIHNAKGTATVPVNIRSAVSFSWILSFHSWGNTQFTVKVSATRQQLNYFLWPPRGAKSQPWNVVSRHI